MQVHASTDHLAQLVYDVARYRVPVVGSFESTLKIGGTYQAPTFLAGFDASNVVANGIPIAALFGEVRVPGRALVLSDAGATFTHGEATLAGSIPLELAPLRLAAPDEPICVRSRRGRTRSRNSRCGARQQHEAHRDHRRTHRALRHDRPSRDRRARRTDQRLVRERSRARADLADRGRHRLQSQRRDAAAGVGAARKRHARGLRRRRLLRTASPPAARRSRLRQMRADAQLDLPAYGNGTLDGRSITDQEAQLGARCSPEMRR